jgi:rSAM/selenodomain-associated transferase 2
LTSFQGFFKFKIRNPLHCRQDGEDLWAEAWYGISFQPCSIHEQLNTPLLSIVIPTLNEAESLPALLADLQAQCGVAYEILAGDGGSQDATRTLVAAAGGIVVDAPRGRGLQLNRAAAAAQGEYLLFLHADSRIHDPNLLARALASLKQVIARRGHTRVAGHFRLRFVRRNDRHKIAYRFIEGKTALNRANTINGDQGMLLMKSFFWELGQFDTSLPFLEDQRLAAKIRLEGEWITLPGRLNTSARRFETEGFYRRYLLMGIIMAFYSAGAVAFFRRARDVYRPQYRTDRLWLAPFFKIGWQTMRQDFGFAQSIRVWYRIGRYVRQNFWHFFYFLDNLTRVQAEAGDEDDLAFLAFHDRYVARLMDFKVCDALTAFACFIWFMLVLGPFFQLLEMYQRGRGRAAENGYG